MKFAEFVKSVVDANADAFQQIPEKRARAIIRALLDDLGSRIDKADGNVVIPGLGRFTVKATKKEKDGVPGKRVMFRRRVAKPGAARAAGAGKGAGKGAGRGARKAARAAKGAAPAAE